MEKTLALFGIQVVSLKEDEKVNKFAYTQNLLSKNVFIEYCDFADENYDESEYEFNITVYIADNTNMKHFCVFYETTQPVAPIDLWRRIVDLVTILEKVEPHAVEQYLEQISSM